MAPLPVNNTDRVWLDYASQGNQHSLMTRWADDPTTIGPSIQNFYETFLNALDDFRVSDWTFIGMRYGLSGTNFTLPLALTPVIDPGLGDLTPQSQALSLNFLGRGTVGGRRTLWSLFGVNYFVSTDFRFSNSENANIASAYTAITTAVTEGLCDIQGSPVIVYQYANQRLNAYWQTESRGS